MMKLPELTSEEIIKGLSITGDREFALVRKYLESAGFDLRSHGAQAREWCAKQAENGSAEAQFTLAKLLILGLYGERDEGKREALLWCEKAAKQDFAPALLMLAGFHESGWGGLEASATRSAEFVNAAIRRGYVPAMTSRAAEMLADGGYGSNRNDAVQLLRQAAELGDASAQCTLGQELLGESAHAAEGIHWIRKAAEQGLPAAHAALGHFYWEGIHGLPKDSGKSRFHLDRAAELEEQSFVGLVRP